MGFKALELHAYFVLRLRGLKGVEESEDGADYVLHGDCDCDPEGNGRSCVGNGGWTSGYNNRSAWFINGFLKYLLILMWQ